MPLTKDSPIFVCQRTAHGLQRERARGQNACVLSRAVERLCDGYEDCLRQRTLARRCEVRGACDRSLRPTRLASSRHAHGAFDFRLSRLVAVVQRLALVSLSACTLPASVLMFIRTQLDFVHKLFRGKLSILLFVERAVHMHITFQFAPARTLELLLR
jgi:hypothetical protein